MNFLLGAVDVARISENVGSSTTTGHGGSSSSAGYGLSLQRQNVITPQLFRQLRQNAALALLSIGGNASPGLTTPSTIWLRRTAATRPYSGIGSEASRTLLAYMSH